MRRSAGLVRSGAAAIAAASVTVACLALPAHGAPSPPVPDLPKALDLDLPAHPTSADLTRVQKLVEGLTARAESIDHRIEASFGRLAAARVALEQASDARDAAHQQLVDQVRSAYMADGGDPSLAFIAGITPQDTRAAHIGITRVATVDSGVVLAAEDSSSSYAKLAADAEKERRTLLKQAQPALELLEQARTALDTAKQAFAADQAALAALQAQQNALSSFSNEVVLAVTPAVSALGRAAQAAQAPILAELEDTPMGAVPQGYHLTGQQLQGVASWYGPGFVGRNTSSGSPYDPQQLTCAMLDVPLGTLVRVTAPSTGRSISLLVTDHGPYVHGRIIDLSERAAALLGVSLAPVVVEAMAPGDA
ncbi:MAG TPA: septal ring lytic transglycosylase RlpA family protein [Mycobacteriales bacterium]|nr:septal ring lytic transglycosylase RlpA family protein [Mycobacteriales bacterium]